MLQMRIAWKPIGSTSVASSRLRAYLPSKYLQEAGYKSEIFNLEHIDLYDVVIFQKAYSKEDISLAYLLQARGIKIVFDLCDNHFYNPENNPELADRVSRLQEMIKLADAVTVSTAELGKHILKPTYTIDDALETPVLNPFYKFFYKKNYQRVKFNTLKLVWFGNAGMETPRFGMVDLIRLLPILEEINQAIPICLTIISNAETLYTKYIKPVSFKTQYFHWNEKTFPYLFIQNNICLIPITQNPFTLCKTSNRLVLSLSLGIPVIADIIPSYEEFSPYVMFSDWENNIFRYYNNKRFYSENVEKGRMFVQERFSKQAITQQWMNFLEQLR